MEEDSTTVVISLEDFRKEFSESHQEELKPPYPRPVVEYSTDGIALNFYDSAREASIATGVNDQKIRDICQGKYLYNCAKGKDRIFLYRGDDIDKRLVEIDQRKDKNPRATRQIKVWQYTLNGRLVARHFSIKEAAIANKTTERLVSNCIKGTRRFIEKSIFLLPEQDIKQRVKEVKAELYRLSKKRPKYKPVDVYNLDGTFIKGCPSASAAAKEFDSHVSCVVRCCNGFNSKGSLCLTSKGKIFLWAGDSISNRLEQIKQQKQTK